MFLRKYWLPMTVFIVAIVGIGLYLLATQPPKDPIIIYKPVEPLPKSEVKAPVGDTSQGGHFHADGTWHDGPHEPVDPQSTADVNETATPVYQRPVVSGTVDISELPKLPDDIDPDDIPPFSMASHSGDGTSYYDRPLTPDEREMYYRLKADPAYKTSTPAGIKMSAVILVRQEKVEAGALQPIYDAVAGGSMTAAEAKQEIAKFYEMTR